MIAKSLVPKVGIFSASVVYFAPTNAVVNAVRNNDIGDLNPIPLTIMSIVSVAWLVYGLSIQDPYVVLSNIGGAIGSIGFVFGLLPLLRDNTKLLRKMQGVGLVGCAASLCLWSFLGLSKLSARQISTTLGMYASALFIVMSGSPLFSIVAVVDSRDSSSISGALTVAQVINSSLWTFYGVAVQNSFVWGPNSIALGLGLVQLALKIMYPATRAPIEISEVDYSPPRPSGKKLISQIV
ncbi:MAG: hypothetical protein SGBAC_010902 [Bacillariaceae sp.]